MALADNLMAFYEFSSNGDDSHTGAHHLTSENSPTHAAGQVGNAMVCNGSSYPSVQIYRHADHDDLSMGDIDWSIACWAYLETAGATRYLVSKWGETTATHRTFFLSYDNSSTFFRFAVGDGSGVADIYSDSFGAISEDTWYFVAFGHRATANQLWINVNATTQSVAHSTGNVAGQGRFVVGGLDTGDGGLTDSGWSGMIDQLGYWKRDISSDLASLYNGGSGIAYTDIVPAAAPEPSFRINSIRPNAFAPGFGR